MKKILGRMVLLLGVVCLAVLVTRTAVAGSLEDLLRESLDKTKAHNVTASPTTSDTSQEPALTSTPAEKPKAPLRTKGTLKQYLADLKEYPEDQELREKVIKLALKEKPAIPEEAREYFVMANSAVKKAKADGDYDRAIGNYQKALLLAPWWPEANYNLARTLELRHLYAKAMASLKFYLLSSPHAKDSRKVQDRIYELKDIDSRLHTFAGKWIVAKTRSSSNDPNFASDSTMGIWHGSTFDCSRADQVIEYSIDAEENLIQTYAGKTDSVGKVVENKVSYKKDVESVGTKCQVEGSMTLSEDGNSINSRATVLTEGSSHPFNTDGVLVRCQ